MRTFCSIGRTKVPSSRIRATIGNTSRTINGVQDASTSCRMWLCCNRCSARPFGLPRGREQRAVRGCS